ncbi:MAG: nucleotidyltransferase domain-containing protein [Patescibacteria group bacterium]
MEHKPIEKDDFETLQMLGVNLLVAFGSRVEGTANDQSDYDVGVVFEKTRVPAPRRYGMLYAFLQEHYPQACIDLVELDQAPYPMQFRAAMKGIALFESSRVSFADFRERATRSYFDFKPILNIHEEALRV